MSAFDPKRTLATHTFLGLPRQLSPSPTRIRPLFVERCQHGAWFPLDEVIRLVDDQDAFFLLAFLRANQGPNATFMCANGLTEKFGWTRKADMG
jgi:hypothetical protein